MSIFEGSIKKDIITTATVSALVTVTEEPLLPSDADDTITGNLGNDVISSGGGSDLIFGELDDTTGNIKYGADKITGGDGDDGISGDNRFLIAGAKAASDTIDGGSGIDRLYGDAGDTMTGAIGGADIINGGDDGDLIWGDADTMVGGKGGNDKINGGAGGDEIYGDAQNVDETALGGNDTILGGDGDDLIHGNGGNDKLTGGADADTFFFEADSGKDQILDFDALEGDLLDLSALFNETTPDFAAIDTNEDGALGAGDDGVSVKGSKMTIDLGVMFGGTAKVDTIVLKGVTSIDGDSIV